MTFKPHPLRGFFRAHYISQEQIAKAIGSHQSAVSLILAGRLLPTDEIEQKLTDFAEQIRTQK